MDREECVALLCSMVDGATATDASATLDETGCDLRK